MTALYEQCEALFRDYPLAVEKVTADGTQVSMVLAIRDPGEFRFYILQHVRDGEPCPFFHLHSWRATGIAVMEADGSIAGLKRHAAGILARAVPLPRDGAMLGYSVGKEITALMPFNCGYDDRQACHVPSWAFMPRVGEHPYPWPVPLEFGDWFWQQYRSGQIIDLGPVVAASPGAVFWADTQGALGVDCCAIARDLKAGDATLRAGVYAYYELLQDNVPVPSLDVMLATCNVTDLASRFAASPDSP
jgi:hypothetical protein